VQFRFYLDSIEEALSCFDHLDEPHKYVQYTPFLFNKWANWARAYKSKDEDTMRPMGGPKIGPEWMKSEFDCLNTFYEFYISICNDTEI